MFKKNLYLFLILVSLLFNVQTSFAHDIEHQYHDTHADSFHDCEDCTLKHQVLKSILLNVSASLQFVDENEFIDNYQFQNLFAESFVAYQSRAP